MSRSSDEAAHSASDSSELMALPLELRLEIFSYLDYPAKVVIYRTEIRALAKRNHWAFIDSCFRMLEPIMFYMKDFPQCPDAPTIQILLKQLMAVVTSSEAMRDMFVRHRLPSLNPYDLYSVRKMAALRSLQDIFEVYSQGRRSYASLLVNKAMHRDVCSVHQEKAEIALDLVDDIKEKDGLNDWYQAISEVSIASIRTASIEFFIADDLRSLHLHHAQIASLMNAIPNLNKFSACVKIRGGMANGVDVSGTIAEPDLVTYASRMLEDFFEALFRFLSQDTQKSVQEVQLFFVGTGYGKWSASVERADHDPRKLNSRMVTIRDYKSRDVRVYSL